MTMLKEKSWMCYNKGCYNKATLKHEGIKIRLCDSCAYAFNGAKGFILIQVDKKKEGLEIYG